MPPEIRAAQDEIEERARKYGLDFFPTIFEVVDYEEMSMLAAFGGFPVRYPHWRFGAEYDELTKGYAYGLQKIYEMVINTDPCYAYLLRANALARPEAGHRPRLRALRLLQEQCLVRPHQPPHARRDGQPRRPRQPLLRPLWGRDDVELFIDACLSLEDLIDPHAPHIQPDACAGRPTDQAQAPSQKEEPYDLKFPSKGYMDSFINPPEVIERQSRERQQKQQEKEDNRSFPEEPVRDVLLFLLEHAPLKDWQRDVLAIIRDEAYYFAPAGTDQDHERGLGQLLALDHHDPPRADRCRGRRLRRPPQRHDGDEPAIASIRTSWGSSCSATSRSAGTRDSSVPSTTSATTSSPRRNGTSKLGLGREKIFDVRRIHNDVTFIDAFLTPEFCIKHKFFSFAYNEQSNYYEIISRDFPQIKQQLLNGLTNHGRPFIYVVDGNYRNRGELFLKHKFQGIELKLDYARDTLANLQRLWLRPVHIETVVDDKPTIVSFDGSQHEMKHK